MPNKNTRARAAPPADGQNSFLVWLRAVDAAVVLTVKVAVCAAVLPTATDVGMLHVMGSLAAVGVIAQLKLTVPVNPPDGVTLIVAVLPVVAPRDTVILPLLVRAKLPMPLEGVAMVTVTRTVSVIFPEVPVTVTT
jgi:hypothetical protein